MKKNYFSVFFFSVTTVVLQAQIVTPVVRAALPSVLDESSGIEITDRNHIWSHNDSGGEEELYEFDSTGVLLRTLGINNTTNNDWEELAQDNSGNYYIGNFGNNSNDRQNLVIYKISNPAQVVGSSVNAQAISFDYPDQYDFPPDDELMNFDMEAMFWFNHSLYLFSKNRTNPYDGYTRLYSLPETPGNYTATLLDSFYLGSGPYFLSSATGADISPNGNTVALLSGGQIFLFYGFSGTDFFGGSMLELNFSTVTQKEALVFISNSELYLTDEKTDNQTGKLYYLNIGNYIITGNNELENVNRFTVYPNPASGSTVYFNRAADIEVTDVTGKLICTVSNAQSMDVSSYAKGVYFVRTSEGFAAKLVVK